MLSIKKLTDKNTKYHFWSYCTVLPTVPNPADGTDVRNSEEESRYISASYRSFRFDQNQGSDNFGNLYNVQ